MSDKPASETDRSTSSKSTRQSTESLHNIKFIGRIAHQIIGAKLPSIKQVFQVMFFNMRIRKFSAEESARLAAKAAMVFWDQARIPTRRIDKCQEELMELYKKWQSIKKSTQGRATDIKNQEEFVGNLDNLFDIATVDALETMKFEEDKKFLLLQREKGRPGCMAGVDMNLYGKEKRSMERKEKEAARKRKHDEMSQQSGTYH